MKINKVYQGDCLQVMKDISDKSIDMILCDLPYGVLNKNNPHAKWDSVISFDLLWEQYERIIKDNGAIVLTAQGMFSANLMKSNEKLWRYNLIWKKSNRVSGFLNANRQPMRNHEDILIFSKGQTIYNPQMTIGEKNHKKGGAGNSNEKQARNGCYGGFKSTPTVETNEKYPISIIDVDKEHPQKYHPTQKPVALFEYLIKTYTNEGDLVLDNCAGSGTTGVACKNLNRNYILIEKEPEYIDIINKRLNQVLELGATDTNKIK